MKTKVGFNLRQVCGENIIVAEGEENIDFSNIISMNESSAFLWREAQKLDNFTVADLVKILTDEYEVDEATATSDILKLTAQWELLVLLKEMIFLCLKKKRITKYLPKNQQSLL